ncbi:MAG: glycosyltransferase family 4 protein [Muribaculaceae bacterium]
MSKRILLVNKFYYNRGGDCVATINLEYLLRANGYEVAVFAMNYPDNFDSPYSKYFAPEISFSGGGLTGKLKAFQRTLGIGDIRSSFARILRDFCPDVVHLGNIHSYLSPVITQMAHQAGCRVVWTMHDYKLLCPSYSCLRDGEPCELCFNDKSQVLKQRCMKGSLAASALAYIEALKWDRHTLENCTDAFICPSQFMAQKMAQGGFSPSKLHVVSNFIDPVKLQTFTTTEQTIRKKQLCYVGRLSQEKGVATMIEAASRLPYPLLIAGDGPLTPQLKEKYASCSNIRFLGRLNADEVSKLLCSSYASILPSEWHENNPLGVIESLCAGTPVIGARNGGIPELISSTSGVVFTPRDVTNLQSAIEHTLETDWNNNAIQAEAINRFSPERHLNQLSAIYNK